MAKVRRVSVDISTGERGHGEPVVLEFNSHPLLLRPIEGSTTSGARFVGQFEPDSVAHSVTLRGPEVGTWDIVRAVVTYTTGTTTYNVEFDSFELGPETSANIWEDEPLPSWDV
jgi:hypothetical protein